MTALNTQARDETDPLAAQYAYADLRLIHGVCRHIVDNMVSVRDYSSATTMQAWADGLAYLDARLGYELHGTFAAFGEYISDFYVELADRLIVSADDAVMVVTAVGHNGYTPPAEVHQFRGLTAKLIGIAGRLRQSERGPDAPAPKPNKQQAQAEERKVA